MLKVKPNAPYYSRKQRYVKRENVKNEPGRNILPGKSTQNAGSAHGTLLP
jgi:hypothetical protein